MAIKDRKRTRFNRLGVIALGYRVFRCDNGHAKHYTRWTGGASQACELCGKQRTDLSEYTVSPHQPGHFVLTRAPEVMAFYARQGIPETEVRELDILFPFAERDRNFLASYQVWAGGNIVCEGDGELVQRAEPLKAFKNDKGYWKIRKEAGDTLVSDGMACRSFDWNGSHFEAGDHVPCSGGGKERLYPQCQVCKLHSMIKVMMADPELFRVGYYRISTQSGNNYDAFDTMFDMLPPNVQGVVFRLRLAQEQTQYKGNDGKLHKTKKWFLYIEPDPDDMRLIFAQRKRQLVAPESPDVPQLEAGDGDEVLKPEYVEDRTPITKQEAKEYWYWATQEKTLSEQEALDAIGVEKLLEYRGTLADAKAQAEAWIVEQMEPPADD